MKKTLLALTVLSVILMAGCSKDEDKSLSEMMIGKWVATQSEGMDMLTNMKIVYTIESSTKGYISASRPNFTPEHDMWTDHMPVDVMLEGDTITLSGDIDEEVSVVAKIIVKSITDKEMRADTKYTVYFGGREIINNEESALFVKVNVDYSKSIVGLWEGRMTSDNDAYSDGNVHRWQLNEDGTYIYYRHTDGGEWVDDVNEYAYYMTDGPMLCMRWKNTGDNTMEIREWWEIVSIEDGVMKWTGLREGENGERYTASFEMVMVNSEL